MKTKLPWTKSRIAVAIIGGIAALFTLYGCWMLYSAFQLVDAPADPTSVNALGAGFFFFFGTATAMISGSVLIVMGVIYAIIMRNLKRTARK